ncbi:MAG: aldo/keto reductase [Chthonomonadales bacterium]|nr:aldo/keto reductase [Chthonomonadales bacterium]
MLYGTIAGIDRPVSRLIMGTMVCTTDDMALTSRLLDAYVARGGNCLDTARVYAGGRTESAVGDWMHARGNRDAIVLIGKGAHPKGDGCPRVSPDGIAEDIAASLERFRTNRIDLCLLHRDDPEAPVGPIVEALHAHREAGRIGAYGGSNWTHARIAEANRHAAANALAPFVASSPYFGLARPNEPMWPGCVLLDEAGLAWHERARLPLLPWSSQAGGFFSGRYAPDDRSYPDVARVYFSDGNWERLHRARTLAGDRGLTPNQVALAYVLCQPLPVFPLIGPRAEAEIDDSLGALGVTLTPDERAWLDLSA